MKRVLIVEDDILAAELERDYLEASDYEVELCSDGDKGYKKAESGIYDLLLLDIMLPGMSGFEICRRIRREQNVPIIMVTAKTEDVDMIRGLGLGADDYIMKPFNPTELVARAKAHIRIHEILLGESGTEK
jgi:DNA-binding response OmpR family regulator